MIAFAGGGAGGTVSVIILSNGPSGEDLISVVFVTAGVGTGAAGGIGVGHNVGDWDGVGEARA